MQRRNFLMGTGMALATVSSEAGTAAPSSGKTDGASSGVAGRPESPGVSFRNTLPLTPIKASVDRIISLAVCTRPFRAQGPRIEAERAGKKTIVHNYGHGGSGWSLSWGSARIAAELARATNQKKVAVIGCGAIGLTSALMAQRAGMNVRIYTKEYIPDVRSFRATGVWSPNARICTSDNATPAFKKQWEEMTRFSFFKYQSMLGLPGNPIEWRDGYKLSDTPFAGKDLLYTHQPYPGEPLYPSLEAELVKDLTPGLEDLAADQHPFAVPYAQRFTTMVFNIPAYARMLMDEFRLAGGDLEIREFTSPDEFAGLPEKTIIHCTGYGARALLKDESIVPVRGQTARLVPQPEVDYAISYESQNVYTVPRRDGILIQSWDPGDYNNAGTTPNRDTTDAAVDKLAKLFAASGHKGG
jgi:hypothetical protein